MVKISDPFSVDSDYGLHIPDRLDIHVKYLYFMRALHEPTDNWEAYEALYVKHILHRNGGKEPRGRWNTVYKRGIRDFLKQAELLYHNLSIEGFRADYPIPLARRGSIKNGAHRLACCAALGVKPVVVKTRKKSCKAWDTELLECLTEKELGLVLDSWNQHNPGKSINLQEDQTWP